MPRVRTPSFSKILELMGTETGPSGSRASKQPPMIAINTMPPPHLPAELLDHTVDHLHDARFALKNCCLVSKSWVPRSRKHLFANVTFKTAARLQSWKTTFPDPSTSPACYTKDLVVWCPQLVTAADAEERGWIRTFSQVVHLGLDFDWSKTSLLPFPGSHLRSNLSIWTSAVS